MKAILKKILIRTSGIIKIANILDQNNLASIYYHDVVKGEGNSYNTINFNKFNNQINLLKNLNYNSLTFEDLNLVDNKRLNNDNFILITFDDGYRSNYELVFPIMKKLNIKFNIFLEVEKINKDENYLTWNMVNEMNESGIVGFGSHTYSHIDLRFMTKEQKNKEIYFANEEIFRNTGIIIKDFCYPYGAYNKASHILLDSSNIYKRIFTSDGTYVKENKFTSVIGRVGIENEDSDKTFLSKLNGEYNSYFYYVRKIKNMLKVNSDEIRRN